MGKGQLRLNQGSDAVKCEPSTSIVGSTDADSQKPKQGNSRNRRRRRAAAWNDRRFHCRESLPYVSTWPVEHSQHHQRMQHVPSWYDPNSWANPWTNPYLYKSQFYTNSQGYG